MIILALIIAAVFPLTAKAVSPEIDSLVNEARLAEDTAQARLYNVIGWKLRYADPKMAIHYANMAMGIAKEKKQQEQLSVAYGLIGICYKNLGEYDEAVKYYEEARTIRVRLGDKEQIAYSNINLANIYINLNDPDKARYYIEEIRKDLNDITKKDIIAYYHLNYGRICTMKGIYDTAYVELNTALELRKELNSSRSSILSTLRLLAELQILSGDTATAIANYQVIIHDSTKMEKSMFADVYNSMANVYLNRGRYDSADYYAHKALDIAKNINAKQKIERIYGTVGMVAYRQKKYAEAADLFRSKLELSNEVYGAELNHNLISAKAAAERMHKEAEIADLENEKSMQKMLNIVFGILVVMILTMLIVFIFYSRMTRNLHRKLDIQKKNLDETNSKITSSLLYAQHIQRSAVSSPDSVAECFPDSMVLYKPRDIVSGDWYRVESRRGLKIIVEADCTGHGVPGSLLSMMGMSALKDILNDIDNTDADFDPAVILTRMRVMVKAMLMQHVDGNLPVNDGMDMTIGIIDPATNIMRFGSAYQMAILIRNGESIKLKGDRQPIGNYVREKEFTSQEIQLQPGDTLFFMSDGIKDQTNPKMEKLKAPRLDDFLLQNIHLPMMELGKKLMERIEEWRGGSMQVDDMTMVGVRI